MEILEGNLFEYICKFEYLHFYHENFAVALRSLKSIFTSKNDCAMGPTNV